VLTKTIAVRACCLLFYVAAVGLGILVGILVALAVYGRGGI